MAVLDVVGPEFVGCLGIVVFGKRITSGFLSFASLDQPFDALTKQEVLTAGIVEERVSFGAAGSFQGVCEDCPEIGIRSAAAHCQLVQYLRVWEPVW